MKALHYLNSQQVKKQRFEWREMADPALENATDALVRPLAIAACDLDRVVAAGKSPFPGPFIMGHEFCGRVVEVGEKVNTLKVGEIVLASFQPSCGYCPCCTKAHSSVCQETPNNSMYGIGIAGGDWPGALADMIRIPWADFNLRGIPSSISPISLASGSDNLADGLRAVDRPLSERAGASVLVAGSGSIALYTVLCAKHLGAERITLASKDRFALEIAEGLGADCLDVESWPKRFDAHEITMDLTNDPDGIVTVLKSTAPYGYCTSGSIYFQPTLPVPMLDMYSKGVYFHTGRVNSASQLDRVIELVAEGLNPDLIEPAIYPICETIDVLSSDLPHSQKLIFTQS